MIYPDDPVPSEPCLVRRSADTRWTPGTPTKAIFPIFPFLFFRASVLKRWKHGPRRHTRARAHENVKSAKKTLTFVLAGLIFSPFVFFSFLLFFCTRQIVASSLFSSSGILQHRSESQDWTRVHSQNNAHCKRKNDFCHETWFKIIEKSKLWVESSKIYELSPSKYILILEYCI